MKEKSKYFFSFFILVGLILLVVPFANAQDNWYVDVSEGAESPTNDNWYVDVEIPTTPINYSLVNVNNSDFWDGLDTPDNIVGSEFWYNQTLASLQEAFDLFVNITGDTMTGDLTVPNINVTSQLHYDEARDTSLVGWWQFNNNQSLDSSIYGNDGTMEGGMQCLKDVCEFDGDGDYVKVEQSSSLNITGDLTVSAWIKIYSADDYDMFVSKYGGSSDSSWFIGYLSGDFIVRLYDTSDTEHEIASTTAPQNNTWYHVAVTYNGTNMSLYVDGVEENSDDITSLRTTEKNVAIGARDDGSSYEVNGTIDEVKIYSRALSEAEIQQIYNEENKRYGYFNELNINYLNISNELNVDKGTLYVDSTNDRVGIGTTSPTHKLNVVGSANITDDLIVGGNLTLGDKITFALGEIIDNLVDGWLTITGNLNVTGNVTAENVFIPQYIFSHTNENISVIGANVWTNITFAQEVADVNYGISHNGGDDTNHTFTIMEDGIYNVDYDLDVEDTSPSASDIDVAGRLILTNGTEVIGSVFETDITKQGAEVELSHNFLVECRAGEQFIFQFIAADADVRISTHGTYGVHPESATVLMNKIANIP